MKPNRAIALILVVSCAGLTQPTDTGVTTPNLDNMTIGKVTHVSDGDTLDIEIGAVITTTRLLGVNAPEHNECFYEKSVQWLTAAVDGAVVRIDKRAIDQYGRTLAYIWRDEQMVNIDLVAMGYAIATTPASGDAVGEAILEAEESALAVGAGLWSVDACAENVSRPDLRISVDEDPPGRDEDSLSQETATISNAGPSSIDLTGWVLRDESSLHRFQLDGELASGASLVISSADPGWGRVGPVWNNDGDMALVLDPSGTVMARSRYRG